MFRFKIESTAKRRSLLALATSANFSTFTSPWPSARNLQPTTAGSPSCEQLDKRLRTKICDSAKLQSQVIPLELHKHQHLPKDASTFKIKDFSSKLSEMNEITWTNIYTIHLCNYVQTPFIPPRGCRVNLQSGSVGCHQTQVSHHGAGTANAQGGASCGPKRCLLGESIV